MGGCLLQSWGADPGWGAPEMGQGVQAPGAGHRSGVSPICSMQVAGNPVRGMGTYPHYIGLSYGAELFQAYVFSA